MSIPASVLKRMLKGLEVVDNTMYIVDDDLYMSVGKGQFDKMNDKKLTIKQVCEFDRRATAEGKEIVICWTGKNRHSKVVEYMQYRLDEK